MACVLTSFRANLTWLLRIKEFWSGPKRRTTSLNCQNPAVHRLNTQSFRAVTGRRGTRTSPITPISIKFPLDSCLTSSQRSEDWRSGNILDGSIINKFYLRLVICASNTRTSTLEDSTRNKKQFLPKFFELLTAFKEIARQPERYFS